MCSEGDGRDGTSAKRGVCGNVDSVRAAECYEVMLREVAMGC